MPLDTILYDPLSYLFHRRLSVNPEYVTSAPARSAVNALLLDMYDLSAQPFIPDNREQVWITNWSLLPAVACLAGCYVLKTRLMWGGSNLQLPVWTKDFLSRMPVSSSPFPAKQGKPHYAEVLTAGFSCLRKGTEHIHPQLQQRLSLPFPVYVETPDVSYTLPDELITVILNYVKKNKIIYTPECH